MVSDGSMAGSPEAVNQGLGPLVGNVNKGRGSVGIIQQHACDLSCVAARARSCAAPGPPQVGKKGSGRAGEQGAPPAAMTKDRRGWAHTFAAGSGPGHEAGQAWTGHPAPGVPPAGLGERLRARQLA